MEAVVCQVCEEVKEFRFSKGKVCSHCNSELISRNGKYNGNQRYICKDCRKTFSDFTNSATYRRFSKGKVCSHCNSELISRNGKYNGNQRYICKDCRKTFSDFTNSATYRSKKSLDKWLKYAKCMIMGLSIRKSAKIVGINIYQE